MEGDEDVVEEEVAEEAAAVVVEASENEVKTRRVRYTFGLRHYVGNFPLCLANIGQDDSDVSVSYSPLPTTTKSGRNVSKPVQFVPAIPSPTAGTKRKRGNRKPSESSVCKVCQRGHSPPSNMIVFCDGCNTPYHQYCHDPPIENNVVQVAEKEWHCAICQRSKNQAMTGLAGLVTGEDLSVEEVRSPSGAKSQYMAQILIIF